MTDCTVVVLAYNLSEYIQDCLNSIEMQETTHKISILIHDDCSTDETIRVIKDFRKKSKLKINLIQAKENRYQYGMDFFLDLLLSCNTKYVAILDGDDIWTDPRKIQLQIDLHEANPDIAISGHTFSISNSDGSENLGSWPNSEFRKPISSASDLAKENFLGALTVVFRRDCLPSKLCGYGNLGTGDYGLWGVITGDKKIGFIDRDMATYRQHSKQIYATKNNKAKEEAILNSRIFVANNSSPEVRQIWANAIVEDATMALRNELIDLKSHIKKFIDDSKNLNL